MGDTVTAGLGKALSKVEIQRVWKEEQKMVNLPSLLFKVEGREVTISVDPCHGGKVPVKEIKRPFQIAIHRKYGPDFSVEWSDGPVPPVRFNNRSLYGS